MLGQSANDGGTTRFYSVLGMLDAAENEREIVDIVKGCLAELSPDDLKTLPEDCWPGRIRDREDIADYALRLARRRALSTDSLSDIGLLDRLVNVLAHASARVGLLASARATGS